MIGLVAKAAAATVLIAVAVGFFLAPTNKRRFLDPKEPIAADGSLIAGRARTIFDTELALREPPPNPDDPKDFEQRIKDDKWGNDRSREPIAHIVGPLDQSFCENARHKLLIAAAQVYYGTRGREKRSFAIRGPHAKAATDSEWSTPLDRRIDDFVRAALVSGFLRKDDLPAAVYPEFAQMFADTDEAPDACREKSDAAAENK